MSKRQSSGDYNGGSTLGRRPIPKRSRPAETLADAKVRRLTEERMAALTAPVLIKRETSPPSPPSTMSVRTPQSDPATLTRRQRRLLTTKPWLV